VSILLTNQCPTIASDATESALWPSARVSVIHTASAVYDADALMRQTTRPRATRISVSTMRLPARSIA
jgi:hypothetical protein